ncbi:MAG: arginase family protein [Gemmatimonadota bacterium]|nr:arginase family protein [Gemmatimonadota bacterium]
MIDHPLPLAGVLALEADPTLALAFAGLPCDLSSSVRRGARQAPARIRFAYDGRVYNATTETGVDLAGAVADLGDWLPESTWEATRESYAVRAARVFGSGRTLFVAGGDHGITVPLVAGLGARGEPVHVVQLDAHPDLYPAYGGDRWSHACTAARLLEMEHVSSVTLIGVRTLNHAQAEVARLHPGRLAIVEARDLAGGPILASPDLPDVLRPGARVWLTVDLDVFDPAFAPGVAHPVPGGLSPRQAIAMIQDCGWDLAGMDVVELLPERDEGDRTAVLAGRLLHEAMGTAAPGV